MAEILRVDADHPDAGIIERAAACLRGGGLVAFPTETVYGLGADATNPAAVRRIFASKGRPSTDPLIVHVADADAMRALVAEVPSVAMALAHAFWPGPLTLVLRRSPLIGDEVTAGLDTVGIRVPAHPVARALVTASGVPIAAPSANLFSRPSPTRAEHVAADLADRVDIILDAGPTPVGVESTVLDLTANPPAVLRPGGVSVELLRSLLPGLVVGGAGAREDRPMAAPGMLTKHYAPRTPLILFEGPRAAVIERAAADVAAAMSGGQPPVLLGSREMVEAVRERVALARQALPLDTVELGPEAAPEKMAARLYAALRECDAAGAASIVALQVSEASGIGLALRDRLRRASAGHVITCAPAPTPAGSGREPAG